MIRQLMADHALLIPVLAGLVLFCAVFLTVVLWTYRKSGKSTYETISRLPLDVEE